MNRFSENNHDALELHRSVSQSNCPPLLASTATKQCNVPKRSSSGILSILKWFKKSTNSIATTSSSSSLSSSSSSSSSSDTINQHNASIESLYSTASFTFIPATVYKPYGTAEQPEKLIAPAPETNTHKKRMQQLEQNRERDKNLTLRKKYKLFNQYNINKRTDYCELSLPLMNKQVMNDNDHQQTVKSESKITNHRRTVSDSCKDRKAGAYLHVKGKRRAPQPPQQSTVSPNSTLGRKMKRQAPQPPDVVCNDSLKIESGILKPIKGDSRVPVQPKCSPISPKPWYKRTLSKHQDVDISDVKHQPLKEATNLKLSSVLSRFSINLSDERKKDQENRKSGVSMLANISELDREAALIVQQEHHKQVARLEAKNQAYYSPEKSSARDLISKFNALSNNDERRRRFSYQLDNETPPMKRSIFKLEEFTETNNGWKCTRCTLMNKRMDIKCIVCGMWKPFNNNLDKYFGIKTNETTTTKINECEKQNDDKTNQQPDENETKMARKFAENVFKAFDEMNNYTEDNGMETVVVSSVTVVEPELSLDELRKVRVARFSQHLDEFNVMEKQDEQQQQQEQKVIVSDEQKRLRQMLKEMRDSLPKGDIIVEAQDNSTDVSKGAIPKIKKPVIVNEILKTPVPEIHALVVTKDTTYENIKVKAENEEKPIKVSAASQTHGYKVTKKPPIVTRIGTLGKGNFELINARDFAGISSTVTTPESPLYVNLPTDTLVAQTQSVELKQDRYNANTLAVNRLLRRLETAIASGQHIQAARLAKDLARLKVNCSVIRQKNFDLINTKLITTDMYIEDQVTHQGPIPLRVNPAMTILDLKQKVAQEFEIPSHVQRWILDRQLANNDQMTLEELNINFDGCPMFLYLVAPEGDVDETLKRDTKKVDLIHELGDSDVSDDGNNKATVDGDVKMWKCSLCTLLNPINRPGCEACSTERPQSADITTKNYYQLMDLDNCDLVLNTTIFECPICLTPCPIGNGVVLRECLHTFCQVCLSQTIEYNEEAEIKCPYRDSVYACDLVLQEREIKALVSDDVYQQHLAMSVAQAEHKIDNAFHCKTPDCRGWCIFEDNVNEFLCPVCNVLNCLTCQVIHEGVNCKQYQDKLKEHSASNLDARRTKDFLDEMVARGEAMVCPTCQVVLMKKWGCDWLRCSMCKTEICWVTRGPRWGPAGKGDTSSGCKCGVNGVKCHPKCTYCH